MNNKTKNSGTNWVLVPIRPRESSESEASDPNESRENYQNDDKHALSEIEVEKETVSEARRGPVRVALVVDAAIALDVAILCLHDLETGGAGILVVGGAFLLYQPQLALDLVAGTGRAGFEVRVGEIEVGNLPQKY